MRKNLQQKFLYTNITKEETAQRLAEESLWLDKLQHVFL